jgi:tRNA pseudouridine38-40 synthase
VFNIKLTLQYDGSNYFGWQAQDKGVTIQQTIENAIKTVAKEEIRIAGAGRTDSGVHALGQVCNFKLENMPDLYRFKYSLNSILPKDISITRAEVVANDFNSRFDAVSRSYIYLFSKIKSPFYHRYSLYTGERLNIDILKSLSKPLIGKYNFNSFCKTISTTENKICEIKEINWREKGELIIFYIEADRFLHGMVRAIAGTLIKGMKENKDNKYIEEVIKAGKREAAGESVPSKGLFLYKVKY